MDLGGLWVSLIDVGLCEDEREFFYYIFAALHSMPQIFKREKYWWINGIVMRLCISVIDVRFCKDDREPSFL